MALQLRPNCEYCDKDLPPYATDARICSYECTFCADCVENEAVTMSARIAAAVSCRGRSGPLRNGGRAFASPSTRRPTSGCI